MKVERFAPEHLFEVNSWWNAAGYGSMPFHGFPKNTFVIFDGDKPIVVGSVYLTDTCLCYMDNIVSNPASTKNERQIAVELLFTCLVNAAKVAGKTHWSAHSKLNVMGEWSQKFKETQRGENHFWFTGEL